MSHHYVVIVSLTALAFVLFSTMGPEMHCGRIVPNKKRSSLLICLVDEGKCMFSDFLVDGFHALLRQGAGILDPLPAVAVRPAVQDPPRAEPLSERRVLRIVRVFRLFLGIQVVEVAEELIEAVHGGQELVPVAQMVLAELAGGITERLQQFRDRRIGRPKADISPGHTDLGEAGTDRVLTGDEGCAPGGAALLSVIVSESSALVANAVNVGRPVAHLAAIVVADVPPADVVAPENEDVRLARFWHLELLSSLRLLPKPAR